MTPQSNAWKILAEKASQETDPEKLMALIHELNRVLLEREETAHLKTSRNTPDNL